MTWGRTYWPIWAITFFALFIGPEVYALVTNWRNTLSNWVWQTLRVTQGQHIGQWTALHLLVFGMFIVLNVWLLGHFFFHLWAS